MLVRACAIRADRARHRVRASCKLTDVFLASAPRTRLHTVAAFANGAPHARHPWRARLHRRAQPRARSDICCYWRSPTSDGAGEGRVWRDVKTSGSRCDRGKRWDWTRCGYVNPLVRYPLLLLLRHATTNLLLSLATMRLRYDLSWRGVPAALLRPC
jgi:hypothetical protein